jgi:hypothetical protein
VGPAGWAAGVSAKGLIYIVFERNPVFQHSHDKDTDEVHVRFVMVKG